MIKQLLFLLILLFPAIAIHGQDEYIAISKRGPVNANPGDIISYTITVGNGDQYDWTGDIVDVLPDEFTYISSEPAATSVVGQTVTWTGFTVLSEENREITVSGYSGRPGSEFVSPLYPEGYYMENSNIPTTLVNSVQLENGTSGLPLSDSYSTEVTQICDFYALNAIGSIKMSTGATMRYLVVVQNLGNVWDSYTLFIDPLNAEYAECDNPDGSPNDDNVDLENALLNLDGFSITETPWIAPGATYEFYLQLTTPNGTPANRWNCTDIDVTSVVSGLMKTATFHTATIQPPSDPLLYIYSIDYPDPVACEGTLNYTIYISNQGTDSYNTTISNIYDPYFEFITSDPLPDEGSDNTWSLGTITQNSYTRVDIQGRILPGVMDQQPIIDSVLVNYDDGGSPAATFADTVETTTLVNAYPDLDIEKISSSNLVRLSDTITYTINYSNVGCGTGTDVTIVDDFDELRTTIVDDGGGVVADGKLTFDIGLLSPEDGMQTLEYSVVVVDVDCGATQIENDATISSSEPDADLLNNSASNSVLAVTAPTWVSFPSDTTVECDNVPAPAVIGALEDIWAEDACGRTVTISYLGETITDGDCGNSYSMSRSWRAEDDYGNFSVRSQLLTVIDTTAPVITCPSFSGYSLSVDEFGTTVVTLEANSGDNYLVSNNEFNATALDNCDVAPVMNYTLTGSTSGSGSDLNGVSFSTGTTEVTWISADDCGNGDTCEYIVVVNAEPSITLTKSLVDIDGEPAVINYTAVGNTLNYNFVIENTGNMTLYNVSISDPTASVTGTTIPELAPGLIDNTSFTASYVITQDDLDNGSLENIAVVSGTAVNTALASDSDTVTVLASQIASMDLTKTSTTDPNTYEAVDDQLTYELELSNTGNVTLYDITVVDTLTGGEWVISTLSPGASEIYTTSYDILQSDLDAGNVINTAWADGSDPDGAPVSATATETVNANQLFTLQVTKTMDKADYVYAEDTIAYQIVLENVGNVNLLNISLTDALPDITSFLDAGQGGLYTSADHTVRWTISQLSPGQTLTFDLRVVVDADVENGSVLTNVAFTENDQTFVVESNDAEVVTLQLPELVLLSVENVDCYGEQTGSISVDVTGGLAPFTFSWQHDASESGMELLNLPAGSYTVTVEDALGNTDELSVSVEEPLEALAGTFTISDVLCNGESNGSIALDVNGGTAPYSFLWSNSATTQNIDNLPAGTYSAIVTDANGCTTTITGEIQQPAALTASATHTDLACNGDGSGTIEVTAAGGIAPYQYAIDGGTPQASGAFSSLDAGDHTILVTDANGCTTTITVNIQQPPALTVSTTISDLTCNGDGSGSIEVTAAGGTAPYQYAIDGGTAQASGAFSNLDAGDHLILVTDATGCTTSITENVQQPPALTVTVTTTDLLCKGDGSGSIELNAAGGTAPYEYAINGGTPQTSGAFSNLDAGNYTILVTDAFGCTWSGAEDISEPEESLSIFNVIIEDVICKDDEEGSISFDISGGTTPYDYLWSNGSTSGSLSDIPGGEYSVTVTDDNGCQLEEDFVVEYEYDNCNIQIPGGLTPNGDFNQILVINGLEKYPNNSLRIFNRYGIMVYEANPYQNDWSGEPNMNHSLSESDGKLPSGTYFYIFVKEPGADPKSGYIVLIKE